MNDENNFSSTPGPYLVEVRERSRLPYLAITTKQRLEAIAIVIGTNNEAHANAALFASAPDAIEALIMIQEMCQTKLGECEGIEPPYIPQEKQVFYEMEQIISQVFEKIHAEVN